MNMIEKTCFFTGHRSIPNNRRDLLTFATRHFCIELIEKHGVTDFISGGALGFDTIAAQIVLELRQSYDIKLHLYLPCYDQASRWSPAQLELYRKIMRDADDYIYITHSNYTPYCMQARNQAMVSSAGYGIVYYTHPGGGTWSTMNYASRMGRKLYVLPKML